MPLHAPTTRVWLTTWLHLLTVTTTRATTVTFQETPSHNDKSVWEDIGNTQFFAEMAHLRTDLPIIQTGKSIYAVHAIAALAANLSNVNVDQITPQPGELINLYRDVMAQLDATPATQDHATLLELQEKYANRSRRSIQEFILTINEDTINDIISKEREQYMVTIPTADIFTQYNLLLNTSKVLTQIASYSDKHNHNQAIMKTELAKRLQQIQLTGYYQKTRTFLHRLYLLTRGIIAHNFLNKPSLSKALTTLAQTIQKDPTKHLATLRDSAVISFPVNLVKHGDTYTLLVSIPVLTHKPLPTYRLMKTEFLFTRDNHAYTLDIIDTPRVLSPDQHSGVVMADSDLKACFTHGPTRYCQVRAVTKALTSNCLFAIYTYDIQTITETCPIRVTQVKSAAVPLRPNQYQILTTTTQPFSLECTQTTRNPELTPLTIYTFTLTQQCPTLFNSDFMLALDATGLTGRYVTKDFNTDKLVDTIIPEPDRLTSEFIYTHTKLIESFSSPPNLQIDTEEAINIAIASSISIALAATAFACRTLAIYITNLRARRNALPAHPVF